MTDLTTRCIRRIGDALRTFLLFTLLPLGLLALFLEGGNLLHDHLVRFVPGPVLGMLLLLAFLKLRIVPYEIMKTFSGHLTKHISFFLIPTSVAILSVVGTVGEYFTRILGLLLASLVLVMSTVAFLLNLLRSRSTLEAEGSLEETLEPTRSPGDHGKERPYDHS